MRAVLLLGVLTLAAPVRPERPARPEEQQASPQQQLMGDWQLVKLGLGAPGGPNAVNGNLVLRISASETLFIINGQPSQGDGLTANYTIDWKTNPVAITFMPKQRGGTMPGILKLEGDTLIMGLTTSGQNRPADFGSAQMVAYYTRVGK